jgi:hypothetical protein
LLVIALVFNLVYGWFLSVVMGRENGLVQWKYDDILLNLDAALGLRAAPIAGLFQGWERFPLLVIYQLMVPMMAAWFLVARRCQLSGALVLTYAVELVVGPALYGLVPGCGPLYAFRSQWQHPPAVEAATVRLSGMPNAFPSLHVGTAFILVLFSCGWRSRAASLAFFAATLLATLSTGEHYVIDLVAGLAFGCFAASAGQRRLLESFGFGTLTLGWSLAVRWEYRFLLVHVWVLRIFVALTLFAALSAVFRAWFSPRPASLRHGDVDDLKDVR